MPIVHVGLFDETNAFELAEGDSLIEGAGHCREGVVIRPVKERTDLEIGRVQLKMVSNRYLAKS